MKLVGEAITDDEYAEHSNAKMVVLGIAQWSRTALRNEMVAKQVSFEI